MNKCDITQKLDFPALLNKKHSWIKINRSTDIYQVIRDYNKLGFKVEEIKALETDLNKTLEFSILIH